MTWDSEAGAIYVYAIEDYHGELVTSAMFNDDYSELSINVDHAPDGRLIGIEIYGIESFEDITNGPTGPTRPT